MAAPLSKKLDFLHLVNLPDQLYDGHVGEFGYHTFVVDRFVAGLNGPHRFFADGQDFLKSVNAALSRLERDDLAFLFQNVVPRLSIHWHSYHEEGGEHAMLDSILYYVKLKNLFCKIDPTMVPWGDSSCKQEIKTLLDLCNACIVRAISIFVEDSAPENPILAVEIQNVHPEHVADDPEIKYYNRRERRKRNADFEPVELDIFVEIVKELLHVPSASFLDTWTMRCVVSLILTLHDCVSSSATSITRTMVGACICDAFAPFLPMERLARTMLQYPQGLGLDHSGPIYVCMKQASDARKPATENIKILNSALQSYARSTIFKNSSAVETAFIMPPPDWVVGIEGGAEYPVHQIILFQWPYFVKAASLNLEESRTKRLILPSDYPETSLLLLLGIMYNLNIVSTLDTGNILHQTSSEELAAFVRDAEEYLVVDRDRDGSNAETNAMTKFKSTITYIEQMLNARDVLQHVLRGTTFSPLVKNKTVLKEFETFFGITLPAAETQEQADESDSDEYPEYDE